MQMQACLPEGQAKAFPGNYFSAMTATGAKGSLVNFSQISCLLGQQACPARGFRKEQDCTQPLNDVFPCMGCVQQG